jgi:hypothetical protein
MAPQPTTGGKILPKRVAEVKKGIRENALWKFPGEAAGIFRPG